MPTLPEPFVHPISYQISWLPEDHPDFPAFRFEIKWRGDYKFAVCWVDRCLGVDGRWEIEGRGSLDEKGWKEWKANHYFEFKDALALVKKYGPKLKVNGMTMKDVLEGKEVQPTLFDAGESSSDRWGDNG